MVRSLDNTEELNSVLGNGIPLDIFGAGDYGRTLLWFCSRHNIDVGTVYVSSKEDKEDSFCGIPLKTLDENTFDVDSSKKSRLIIALSRGELIAEEIERKGIFDCIFLCTSSLIEGIFEEQWEISKEIKPYQCIIRSNYPGIENDYVMLEDLQTQTPMARAHITVDVRGVFADKSLRDSFESIFGRLIYYKGSNNYNKGLVRNNSNSSIYVATSGKDASRQMTEVPQGYILINVGAAISGTTTECIRDDSGENISKENNIYSECTAHYWIWKNDAEHEYVGVNHYRRLQHIDDHIIDDMRKTGVDMLLAMPQFTGVAFKEFYLKYSTESEWQALEEVLRTRWSEYTYLLKTFAGGNIYFPCNIIFARKEVFDDYCSFMFSVTSEIRWWFKSHNITERPRYMGYLTEILENLYIMKHKNEYKVGYTDIFFKR